MKHILLLLVGTISFFSISQTCGESFYDSGGVNGQYTNDEQDTTTLCPTNANEMLMLNFSFLDLEANYDTLFIFNGNSTNASLIGAYSANQNPGIVYGENPSGCLTFVFSSDASVILDGWEASITCVPFPSCPRPVDLIVNSLQGNTVDISWTAGGTETEWMVEYETIGFPIGTGIEQVVNANSVSLTNLNYSTNYDFYVRAICGPGDTSLYAYKVSFVTEMNPFICGNYFYDAGGPNNMYPNTAQDTTTICPTNANEVISLDFSEFNVQQGDTLMVFNGNSVLAPFMASYTGMNADLGVVFSTSTDGCLSFIFKSDGFGQASGWAAPIACVPPITCLTPTNVSSNALSDTQIEVAWTANNSETEWMIEYGETGFTQGNGTSMMVNTNPITLNGLNPTTIYDFYVKSICTVGDTSFASIRISDTTFLSPFTCGNMFYDEGGPFFQYQNNSQDTTVICAGVGEIVTLNFTAFNVEQDYDTLFIYDGPDTSSPLIGAYTGINSPGFIIAGSPSGCITTVFFSDDIVPTAGWEAQISCVPTPTCFKPTNITVEAVSTTTVDLSWTNGGSETEWMIEYGAPGFVLGTGTTVLANTNPFQVTGLNTGTMYDLYMRSVCSVGDTSFYSSKVSFSTYLDCNDSLFDSGGSSNTYTPNENYTQTICSSNGDAIQLVFSSIDTELNYDTLFIYNGSTSASDVLSAFTGLFADQTITANNLSGCLTIRFTSDGSVENAGWEAIINCVPQATCFSPTNVSVNSTTDSSATISWQAGNLETEWLVEYGAPGFQQGTGTSIVAATNSFTLNNLNGSSVYEFYIRSICGVNDSSSFAGPYTFNTLLSPFICGNLFTDNGGTGGNYSLNLQDTITICPTNANESVEIIFSAFDVEQGYDTLYVFNGSTINAPLLGAYTGLQNLGTIAANNTSGCLTFVFHSDDIVALAGWEAQISCVPSSFCAEPTNIVASNITAFSASVTWQAGSNETQWEVEYGLNGFTPGTGTITSVSTASINLIGLDNATPYDVYVRAICNVNDTSMSISPMMFSTLTPTLDCGNPFFDNGGPNFNYELGTSDTTVICPTFNLQHMKIDFTALSFSVSDTMYVFDGSNTNAPLLATFTNGSAIDSVEATNSTGCLTVVFNSFAFLPSNGWEATIICVNEAGLNELNADLLSLYPNPAKTSITIENQSGTQFEFHLTDVQGKEIKLNKLLTMKGFSAQQFDIEKLEKGMYFMTAISSNGKITKSFIKE